MCNVFCLKWILKTEPDDIITTLPSFVLSISDTPHLQCSSPTAMYCTCYIYVSGDNPSSVMPVTFLSPYILNFIWQTNIVLRPEWRRSSSGQAQPEVTLMQLCLTDPQQCCMLLCVYVCILQPKQSHFSRLFDTFWTAISFVICIIVTDNSCTFI